LKGLTEKVVQQTHLFQRFWEGGQYWGAIFGLPKRRGAYNNELKHVRQDFAPRQLEIGNLGLNQVNAT
jgi:hypothetical protein